MRIRLVSHSQPRRRLYLSSLQVGGKGRIRQSMLIVCLINIGEGDLKEFLTVSNSIFHSFNICSAYCVSSSVSAYLKNIVELPRWC